MADWASYHLTDAYLIRHSRRTEDFRPDPYILLGKRSELVDYRGSGFDRGHLVPAADMARSHETMSESFLLSNMAPQIGPGFNRGIWRVLEEKVRGWVTERKNLYVITGPLYLDDERKRTTNLDGLRTIGPNRVSVPTHFYKIIVSAGGSPEDLDAIAFIVPNASNPPSSLSHFLTSIDEIERLSGLDFIHEMEDTIEDKLESQRPSLW